MSEWFGSWRLDALLAVGGLAEIWRGSRGREDAAIKRLHTHLLRHSDVRDQFAVERSLTTELPHHPNLIHAVDTGDVQGRPYLALVLAPGEDLRRQLYPPPAPGVAPEQAA